MSKKARRHSSRALIQERRHTKPPTENTAAEQTDEHLKAPFEKTQTRPTYGDQKNHANINQTGTSWTPPNKTVRNGHEAQSYLKK